MPWKLCGWHGRMNHDHIHCIGDRLKMRPREFAWGPRILYNPGDLNLKSSKEERLLRSVLSAPACVCMCVHFSHLQLAFIFSRLYILDHKSKEKKEIIFLYICIVVFPLLYNNFSAVKILKNLFETTNPNNSINFLKKISLLSRIQVHNPLLRKYSHIHL